MRLHPQITKARIERAIRDQEAVRDHFPPGFCNQCGEMEWNVPPDSERAMCEKCGKKSVYGSGILIFSLSEKINKKRLQEGTLRDKLPRRPALLKGVAKPKSYTRWYSLTYGRK